MYGRLLTRLCMCSLYYNIILDFHDQQPSHEIHKILYHENLELYGSVLIPNFLLVIFAVSNSKCIIQHEPGRSMGALANLIPN